ncbi:MAG: glycosyltransferase family 1 protein [Pseudomonadota bacterium]
MRISIVTDAWRPQINGVVRTLGKITDILEQRGHELQILTSDGRATFGLPTYPEIRLAIASARTVGAEIAAFTPEAVHIATEGTLGLAARRFCRRQGLPFTTGYHTRFPEMIRMRWPVPGIEPFIHRWFRWFHRPAKRVMVPTPSMARVLKRNGFDNVVVWARGVDHELFRPRPKDAFPGLPRPIALCAGRVAIEKGLPDFLDLDLPGTKVIVGDGPLLQELKARYPNVHFTGYLEGESLARAFASADVFVFPSRTDTFGLVMIEALACGVPVAAFDVPGPRDIVTDQVGAVGPNLGQSVRLALLRDPDCCRSYASTFSWEHAAELFESYLAPIRSPLQDECGGPADGLVRATETKPALARKDVITGALQRRS